MSSAGTTITAIATDLPANKKQTKSYTLLFVMTQYGILQRKRAMRDSSVVILQASLINLLNYMYILSLEQFIITCRLLHRDQLSDNGNVDLLWNTYTYWSLLNDSIFLEQGKYWKLQLILPLRAYPMLYSNH